jgi:hypothetical protein
MSYTKIGLLTLLIVIAVVQFIQPAPNQSRKVLLADITNVYPVPDKVQAILKNSCYDCHSNNTRYPWYSHIQPWGWWLASHIRKGKEELNFTEFGNYSKRRQQSKLKSIGNSIEDETMPLPSYTLIHRGAKLSKEDKTLILDWAERTKDSLSQQN